MKRILVGVVLGVVAFGGAPALAATCGAKLCPLAGFATVVADICEDGEDCTRVCAPFEDPIICAP